MPLNVDPAELISSAAQLAGSALGTHAAIPAGWVVPAGADPISAQAVPALNAQAAELFNNTARVLHGIHGTAGDIGASAADYTATDAQGGTMVGGAGGSPLANPVAPIAGFDQRISPDYDFPGYGPTIDPLTFAQHLHTGPGPGPASGFAQDVRAYLGGAHADALTSVADAAQTMQNWTPVGDAAAAQLSGHADDLDALGSGLQTLVDAIETYSTAFQTAKAVHPTPQEIIATRKELLAAMRSKNEPATAVALAKFEEQNARSAATIGNYATTVGAGTASSGTASQTASTASGNSSTSGNSSSSGSDDTSALTSMLPALMSMMSAGTQGLSDHSQDPSIGDSTDDLSSYDDGGGGGGSIPDFSDLSASPIASADTGSSVGDATSADQTMSMGAMPMVAAAGLDTSSLPAAPVTEAFSPASVDAQSAGAARSGSSGMPYMPMMPGANTAGAGGERNRVVAWHPDRLMYVDDTPHTEQVIGEKPTIAPSITPPTPLNQIPSQSGGST